MSEIAFSLSVSFETITCFKCGVQFGVPTYWKTKRVDDHQGFWCPNGHEQAFIGETVAQKLQKELDREKQRREMAEREVAQEKKLRVKADKKLARVTKRISAGVCLDCHRTFQNLARHVQTKHGGHVGEKP